MRCLLHADDAEARISGKEKEVSDEPIVIGPTGEFPDGKLNEDDAGELQLAIGHNNGNVIVQFGTAVSWFALLPEGARGLAEMLLVHADNAEKETN
jgi:hypothetical protein